MDVWVVMLDREDWDEVVGVYATRESADKAIRDDRRDDGAAARRVEEYTVISTKLEN